jgi:(2Fe-2S) ferredoxin
VLSNVYLRVQNQPLMKHFSRSPECVFYVCCGSKCKKKGGKQLYKRLKSELDHRHHFRPNIQVIKTGCTDRCKKGPILAVMPQNEWHLEVTEERGLDIFNTATALLPRN